MRNSVQVQNPRLVAAFAANAGLIPLVAAITDSVALVSSAVHCFGCRWMFRAAVEVDRWANWVAIGVLEVLYGGLFPAHAGLGPPDRGGHVALYGLLIQRLGNRAVGLNMADVQLMTERRTQRCRIVFERNSRDIAVIRP
jgi:hypothetical protein